MYGLAGLLSQQQQLGQSLLVQSTLQGVLGGFGGSGLGAQAQRATCRPQMEKEKKSFKDELQDDVDIWLKDVEL